MRLFLAMKCFWHALLPNCGPRRELRQLSNARGSVDYSGEYDDSVVAGGEAWLKQPHARKRRIGKFPIVALACSDDGSDQKRDR
jgi:hypothetical protein